MTNSLIEPVLERRLSNRKARERQPGVTMACPSRARNWQLANHASTQIIRSEKPTAPSPAGEAIVHGRPAARRKTDRHDRAHRLHAALKSKAPVERHDR
jgi:hypothetical protein